MRIHLFLSDQSRSTLNDSVPLFQSQQIFCIHTHQKIISLLKILFNLIITMQTTTI
jgi:hypothetical protein